MKSFRKCCLGLYFDRTSDWLSRPLQPPESICCVMESQHRAPTFPVCPWPLTHTHTYRKVRGYQSPSLMHQVGESLTLKVSLGLLKRHYCVSLSGALVRGVEVMSLSCTPQCAGVWTESVLEVHRWHEKKTGGTGPDRWREKHSCHIYRVEWSEKKQL